MNFYTEIAYIYVLIDPRDNTIRYVGKTIRPNRRILEHISETKTHNNRKSTWIRKLLKMGLKPSFKIVKVCPLKDFVLYESEYIKIYKSSKLTNSDESGQGFYNRNKKSIEKTAKKRRKLVYKYDLSGNFICKYKSVEEASKILNINAGNISKCCNYKFRHTGGFIFRYNKEQITAIIKPNAVKTTVIELDTNNNPIQMWSSLMDCSRDTNIDNGNLSRVCNNKLTHIKGRIFRFGSILSF